LLKVVTIIIFMILGIVVNCGGNTDHHYIGGENWHIPGAPFHDGIGGFASVFVTAAFACGSSFPREISTNHDIDIKQMAEPSLLPSPLARRKILPGTFLVSSRMSSGAS
jgi:hypothetical protein